MLLGYKVVYDNRVKLLSAHAALDHSTYSIEYKIGEQVSAKIGLLFFFEKYKNAEDFSGDFYGRTKIYKCEVIAPTPLSRCALTEGAIKEFWSVYFDPRTPSIGYFSSTPFGTYGAETIKLLKEAKDES